MESKADEKYIKFNFDVSAYRLLGRELITDKITALFEIVKNAYDANANQVTIKFVEVLPKTSKSKIIIKDDGIGMNFNDIKYKWMVIGTSSKRRSKTSPAPHKRKVVGKKGIGRFAVDLLGSKLTLKTKQKGSKEWIFLETDWSKYIQLEQEQLSLSFEDDKDFFTDVKNQYWFEEGDINEQGTILEIEKINTDWTDKDIIRAYKEFSKLVLPNSEKNKYPFNIKFNSPFPDYEDRMVKPLSFVDEYATISIELKYDETNDKQEIIRHEKGTLVKKLMPKYSFGSVSFKLYYFNQSAKRKLENATGRKADGVQIYRDGLITTPFAEQEEHRDKRKDILGIDKRRWSGFFDKISNRDLIGIIEITDKYNSEIKETTNRQGFIHNEEWQSLNLFVIEHIEQIEQLIKYEREHTKEKTQSHIKRADIELKQVKKNLSEIKKVVPKDMQNQLKNVESTLNKLQGTFNKSVKDYKKLEEESKQKENLFFSLVSLQTYASMFAHMTRHTLGHVLRDAEYFKDNFPNEELNDNFKLISGRMYGELVALRKGIDFMLKYAKPVEEMEEIDLLDLLDNLFYNIYQDVFNNENITAELALKKNLILNYNRKTIEDIFENLISNSIKALKNRENKKIKCSGLVSNNELILYFSDNGMGILEEDKYRIFDVFFTKTAEYGGAGIGLYMVRTRIEAMQGSIEVVENEFKPIGATFKITLPFKK